MNLLPARSWLWWFRDALDKRLGRLMGGRWDGVVWFEVGRVSTKVVSPDHPGVEHAVAFWWLLPFVWANAIRMDVESSGPRWRSADPDVWLEVET